MGVRSRVGGGILGRTAIQVESARVRRHSGLRYLVPVDLDDINNPHTLAVLSTPIASKVLDVGCGPGVVAGALAKRRCAVWGIEADPAAARLAERHCKAVIVGDVELLDLSEALADERFDVILLLDILEHLRNPGHLLRRLPELMNPGGIVMASIPNVAHGAVRLALLSGEFRYSDKGLLDRDHLRFFDAAAVNDLFGHAGYSIRSRLRVTRDLDETEIHLELASYPNELVEQIRDDPAALTYQFFVIASPSPTSRAERVPSPQTLTEKLQLRIAELERRVRQAELLRRRIEEMEGGVAVLHEEVRKRQTLIEAMESTKLWRLRGLARSVFGLQ